MLHYSSGFFRMSTAFQNIEKTNQIAFDVSFRIRCIYNASDIMMSLRIMFLEVVLTDRIICVNVCSLFQEKRYVIQGRRFP